MPQQQVSERLRHLVRDQDVDPVGLLPVDVGDLLRRDAVEHGDPLTQVQQRRLLQVHSSVDCGGGRRDKEDHQGALQAHVYVDAASLLFPAGEDETDLGELTVSPSRLDVGLMPGLLLAHVDGEARLNTPGGGGRR